MDDQVSQVPVIVDLELRTKKHVGEMRGRELEPLLENTNKSRALCIFIPEFLL